MKQYKHRYFGKMFNFDLTYHRVSDVIHSYLSSTSLEDFMLKLELVGIKFEVEGNEK
jgi:hypothetical protein